MIVETLRMVEAALLDATSGVNAQLAVLPLDTPNGSAVPDPRPAPVTVRNAADHDTAVREAEETAFPLLLVDLLQPATAWGQVWSGVRDAKLELIVAYLVDAGDVAGKTRATDYTLRAAAKAIHAGLLAAGKRDTVGTRNGFVLSVAHEMDYGPTHEAHAGGVMTGAVKLHCTVRDTTP